MEKNSKDFKKIIKLKYPEYIGTKDLEKFQKKNKNRLKEIEKSNLDLQTDDIFFDIFQKSQSNNNLKGINVSAKNNKDSTKLVSDIITKKYLMKKLNNPRKYLEKKMKNSNFPSFLLDYIHPHEYLFNHKIKGKNNINIKNNSNKNHELILNLNDNSDSSEIRSTRSIMSYYKKPKYFSRNKHSNNNIQNYSSRNKSKIFCTENNFFNRNTKSIIKKSRNKKYYLTENSNISNNKDLFITDYGTININKRKKELFNNLNDINERSNEINKDIKGYYVIEKKENTMGYKKLDKILSKLLDNNIKTDAETIKNLFKKMKKKNYFSELAQQYFSCKKKSFPLQTKQNFMKGLFKMNVMEKKETLFNYYRYNNDYTIKDGFNKLKEKELSKERTLFNKKITKMKNLNIKYIRTFNNTMNYLKTERK